MLHGDIVVPQADIPGKAQGKIIFLHLLFDRFWCPGIPGRFAFPGGIRLACGIRLLGGVGLLGGIGLARGIRLLGGVGLARGIRLLGGVGLARGIRLLGGVGLLGGIGLARGIRFLRCAGSFLGIGIFGGSRACLLLPGSSLLRCLCNSRFHRTRVPCIHCIYCPCQDKSRQSQTAQPDFTSSYSVKKSSACPVRAGL